MSRIAQLSLVAVVTMSGLARAQAPRLVHVRDIGCADCAGPAQFSAPRDVALGARGSVLVLDADAPFVRMFDTAGAALWSSGRDGMGPGEFQRPQRAVPGPDGVQVVDMSARRITRLDARGQYQSGVPVPGFPAAVSGGPGGAMVIAIDDFRGGLVVRRWSPTDSGRAVVTLPPPASPAAAGTITFTAVAVAPDGGLAIVRDVNAYRIERYTAAGGLSGVVTRDVARVKRTPEEIAALNRTIQQAGRAAAERGRGGPPPPLPARSTDVLEFKPHFVIDGLRYDDAGRLWARTMRGSDDVTVFDVFTPGGAFIGEVRLDVAVSAFSLGAGWLAAATATPDGVPIVKLYRVIG